MLSPRRRAVLDALLPGLDARFDAFYADFEKHAPLPMRLAFLAAVETACWVAPLLAGRRPPLTRLSPEDAAAALEALGRSRSYLLRQQMLVLKSVVSFHYGALPETKAELRMAP